MFCLTRRSTIAPDQQQRINGEINAPEIRLVGPDGEPLGIVPLAEALAKAEAAELDLVEIAPTAMPPVARIMDFGKFKYREAQKQHEESFPRLEGRQMVMLLAPKKTLPKAHHPNKPEAGKPPGKEASPPAAKATESTAVGSK